MLQKKIEGLLSKAGIENAGGEARLLCEAFKGEALLAAVERRIANEPLQYILGEWGFYRETYEVNEHCLCPRPDTEHLVEQAIKMLPEGARFLDLCTGSGCVAISTLAARADTTAVAVDLFEQTLETAARNAQRNGVAERLSFLCCDVLKPPASDLLGGFDAILSNPPYIRAAAMETLSPEVKREPQAALYGGEDGLDFYRAILDYWTPVLKKDGFLAFEIGYDQASELEALASAHGYAARVFRDYGGNDRVVLLTK